MPPIEPGIRDSASPTTHRHDKPVLAINQGVTRADHLLDLKIEADCSAVLERLLALAIRGFA